MTSQTTTYTVRVTPRTAPQWSKAGFATLRDALRYTEAFIDPSCATDVITPSGRVLAPADYDAIGRGETERGR